MMLVENLIMPELAAFPPGIPGFAGSSMVDGFSMFVIAKNHGRQKDDS
ncbi:MAG: hypothetical protein LBI62_01280 [Candidatus Accumulibacter sp.]|nr:hypothetical protein [Accumulibacter sp.]